MQDLDLDVRWAAQPDTLLRLTPSRRWMMHALRLGEAWVFVASMLSTSVTRNHGYSSSS